MKKITIVGRGTVGCMAVAHFLKYSDWEIDWAFDPNVEPAAVGEGTTLDLPRSLYNCVQFDGVDLDAIHATPKLGIWKRGWGIGEEFYHTFPAGEVGMHFNAVEFQKYMFLKLSKYRRIRSIQANITDFMDIDSDHVMVCTGSPNGSEPDIVNVDTVPVNSCVVFQCPWELPRFNYSVTFAKKYGWVFGIPLQNRVSFGYLFNKDINTVEEIKEDLKKLLSEFKVTPNIERELNFKSYFRRNNFNDKVCYNGNASFFLEPLEATSTTLANYITRLALDTWNGKFDLGNANWNYHRYLNEINSMISLHYYSGSVYDTKFWDHAKSVGEKVLRDSFSANSTSYDVIKKSLILKQYNFEPHVDVGTWGLRSYITNINRLGLTDKLCNLVNEYQT